jgi:hypothetical protein
MHCKDRGKWHMGMSPEACMNGGGQFFRSRCITLQKCIDARPRDDEVGYNQQFEDWVQSNEIEIYDSSDEAQCEHTREALNFDSQYLDDQDVCETFNDIMCDEFFDDLAFLAGSEDEDEPVEFVQVVYKPIT